MKAMILNENNEVVNVILVDSLVDVAGAVEYIDGANIKDSIVNGVVVKYIPPMEPLVIPQVVTMRQARLALHQSNLLATVDTAIATGTDEAMKIEWEYAAEVRRDWDSLTTLATALGMPSVQLDDLFLLASTL